MDLFGQLHESTCGTRRFENDTFGSVGSLRLTKRFVSPNQSRHPQQSEKSLCLQIASFKI